MGMESSEWYNNFCLIGHTEERGKAWHYMESMQGDEPNHYPGAIPFDDVVRRLFNWKPMVVRTANLVPCKQSDADYQVPMLGENGKPYADDDGKPVMMPVRVTEVPNMRGVVRSDDPTLELGHHTAKYRVHDYEEWLLKLQSNVIGDSLDIWSAILLRNGAQACVQVALPETAHDDKTGMDFVPYVHGYTSLDGSLSTTFAAQTLLIVCDNTMHAANRRAESSGRQYRARHTSGSLDSERITEVQQALSIIHQTAESSMDFFHELAAIKVPPKKWVEVMDIIMPKADQKASVRMQKGRETKRELLDSTYHTDPMATTWNGTALGVVQAVNTYATHYASVKGASRTQRNVDKVIRGEFEKVDTATLQALATVLNKPELVAAK